MTRQTVSVVIPFFNGSRWIQKALDSVYSQTDLPNEVIVVNDGSSPEETAFIEQLSSKFGFSVLHQKNEGQSSARNLGVLESKSQFVCFLDQDDYFLPDHIKTLLSIVDASDTKFSFSYGDLYRVSESGEILSKSCVNVKNPHPLMNLSDMLRHNMYILPSATLINRDAFIKVGGFDETLRGFEDDDLFVRFYVGGFTNSFTHSAVSAWTVNPESTSFSESMSRSRHLYFLKLMKTFVYEPKTKLLSTQGVFSELLYPRFSINYANDVVSSALGDGEYFKERVERLQSFRALVRLDQNINIRGKVLYLTGTWLLVALGRKTQATFLKILLVALNRFGTLNIRVFSEFVRLHSISKKSLD